MERLSQNDPGGSGIRSGEAHQRRRDRTESLRQVAVAADDLVCFFEHRREHAIEHRCVEVALGGEVMEDRTSLDLVLIYASANRDEDEFDDPFEFRIDHDNERHPRSGVGEHFCLGAKLAKRSQRALWLELARRPESVELSGTPEWIQSPFVVGLKHLPVRYRLQQRTID